MDKKSYLFSILDFFHTKNIDKVERILLQKAAYVQDFLKKDTGFSFEAYIYGPFSRDIGDTVDEMEFDEILETNSRYIWLNGDNPPDIRSSDTEKGRVREALECYYDNVLEGKTDFTSVELNGTVMFVMDVLELEAGNGELPDFDDVLKGVRKWKLDKFSEKKVRGAYDRVADSLWQMRGKAA